ncbi:FtsK/SpoIIIE domain-containing protein [Paenibacillus doosanensis]|uniref:FtsK/SpoIIIE domain-containing protein n=1 Tax=Paenibacillus doosanensis TaxID=1229154 RepID=UPI00217F7F04|nr:FtsK/SpoIIIE domain-containing protein [Paenibacillus doosanensis]MCS7460377.1 FtsK/SpoIIIE domain-containing protein [Paenibacillus doosanensis]
MSSQIVLSDILASIVSKRVLNESYGVLLKDLPKYSYSNFINMLELRVKEEELAKPNVFFVGFTEAELDELRLELNSQLTFLSLYYSVEEAEDFRNDGDVNSTRIVIVKRAVPKLSSLRWYEQISSEEIYKVLCDSAEKQLGGINESLRNMWKSLNSKKIMEVVSLERLIDYYQYLMLNDDDIPRDSIEHLFRLGLLIDESVFVKSNIDSIRQRLIENSKLVSRISNLNKEDRKAIQSNPDSDKFHSTRSNILRFYSTRDVSVLGHMKYSEVQELLSKVKNEKTNKKKPVDDDNGPEDSDNSSGKSKRKPDSPESTAVDLIIEHDTDKVKGLLDEIEQKYTEWEKAKASKVNVESENESTRIEFIPEIHSLIQTFVGENSFGGVIKANVKNPIDAFRSLEQFRVRVFDKEYIDGIKEIIALFEDEYAEAKGLLEVFNELLSIRSSLVSAAHRLADCPMLKIVETDEILKSCAAYVELYGRVLKLIKQHYGLFSSFSPKGSKQLVASINSLDMIYIIGEESVHATSTPLFPLYLWKYVELTVRLRESSSSLSEIDKDFLVRASGEIPNPLPTAFVSSYISNKGDRVIPEVSQLGKLPIYSSEQQVNQMLDGLEVIEKSLTKLIKVYPHSSFGLRAAFVNPPSVKHVFDLVRGMLRAKDIRLQGAHIHIFKTKETPENWSSFDDVDDTIYNKFALSNDPNFSIKIETVVLGFEALVELVKKHHFHTVILFDPCGKSVSNIRRNPLLKIHPLCIPKVFEYDPIADKVEILPASDGNIFSDHHDLIGRLNDKPQGWHHTIVLELETSKQEFNELLEAVPWLIVADANLKNLEMSVIGSEKCIYYQSKSFRDVGIYSNDWAKLTKGMDNTIRSIGNYDPKEECVGKVLRTIQGLNERGVLSLASSKIDRTFNIDHTKGALGTAISAIWSKQDSKNFILVSLDTELAQSWLDEREEGAFSDLIGITFDEHQALIDIIEVKTYDGAYQIDKNEITGKAVEQVNSVRSIIHEIFNERDKITSTSRRELLRFQAFRSFYQLPMSKADKKEWTYQLNRLFAGEIPVTINSSIHHVRFSEQGTSVSRQFDSDYKINLLEIRDDFINKVLVNCCEVRFESKFDSISFKGSRNSTQSTTDASNNISSVVDTNQQVVEKELEGKPHLSSDSALDRSHRDNGINNGDENIDAADFAQEQARDAAAELNDQIIKNAGTLFRAMRDYSIDVSSVDPEMALVAARFIRFRVRLRAGETLQKVLRYRTDITREIEAESEILVGNERGTQFVFVDVPRKSSDSIKLLDYLKMLPRDTPVGNLNVVIGQDPSGEFKLLNIAQAPHMLTAGSTGSGKTIFLYSLIVSLISQYSHEQLEFVIIDPKQTDFIFFDGLPHLRNKEVILDAEKAVEILTDLTENELERRTDLLRQSRSRDLFSYNQKNPEAPLKPIVVIIDEYADLVQVADLEGRKKDFERQMIRLAQRSRNVGIHLVVATQRPSADIVTSNLKTNIPCRISFRLPAHQDSMTILDSPGAEDLLGKGDMLFSLNGDMTRLQGLYISEEDLEGFLEKYIY